MRCMLPRSRINTIVHLDEHLMLVPGRLNAKRGERTREGGRRRYASLVRGKQGPHTQPYIGLCSGMRSWYQPYCHFQSVGPRSTHAMVHLYRFTQPSRQPTDVRYYSLRLSFAAPLAGGCVRSASMSHPALFAPAWYVLSMNSSRVCVGEELLRTSS